MNIVGLSLANGFLVHLPSGPLAWMVNLVKSSGLLQTAQTWANAGVCGGLCACAVGGTFD